MVASDDAEEKPSSEISVENTGKSYLKGDARLKRRSCRV